MLGIRSSNSEMDAIEITAPARVNLLGEHTDYTGGLVLPMAIPFRTKARITSHGEGRYEFRSDTFAGIRSVLLADRSERAGDWSDYPVGVLRELQRLGVQPPPFKLELSGNVPFGAGLSSSASVEVATCLALLRWSGSTLTMKEIALLCQRAENLYVGSPCGIMDQAVITAARAGHATLLNTRNLSFEAIPMNTGGFADACIVVCNSEVKHSVATGEYGVIRRQMEAGQALLRERFAEVEDLGMATLDQLETCRAEMPLESYKRCRHVISENGRVCEAQRAMLAGDVDRMGVLMTAGHASQRDDLGTSCEETDLLVDAATNIPGCFGARMTGGGFGGCTVNLVAAATAQQFSAELRRLYKQRYGIEGSTYICEAVDGAVAANRFVVLRTGGARG